jgi:hypothetical protein
MNHFVKTLNKEIQSVKLEVIYASFNTYWFSGTGGKPTSTRNSLWRMDCLFLAGRNAPPAVKIELSSLCL